MHETLTTRDLSEEVGVFEILHTAVTDTRIEKVRAAMKHDQSMQILIRTIQSGWPNERRRCPKQIQDFWNIRDELAIVDDASSPLVIKGHRIVIPPEQREEIIQQLHIGHFGIEKTKQRARDAVYWPRLNTDIESLIARLLLLEGDVEAITNNFNEVMTEVATDILGFSRPKTQPWVTDDILNMCDTRILLKPERKTSSGKIEYRKVNKQIRKGMKEAK